MIWIRKNYKLTLALLALSTAFFTWSVNNGGPLARLSASQAAKLERKIEQTKKAVEEKIKETDKKVQALQVKQAKDSAEIKAGLEAVKKELGEQRNDTRQVRNDTQEVLRLLVKIQSKL